MKIFISRLPTMEDWDEFGTGTGRRFVRDMLFKNSEVRQGWGYSTYDLRQGKSSWVIQAMNNPLGKPHQTTSTQEGAEKRFDVLKAMLEIKEGDIIIIPATDKNHLHNYNVFTVATATGDYNFEKRNSFKEPFEKDFGHTIPVSNIKCFTKQDFHINFRTYQRPVNRVHNQEIYKKITENYLSKTD